MSTANLVRAKPLHRIGTGTFERVYSTRPDWLSRAPGRVNLIGGHVDYNDGLVLPVAIERSVEVSFSPRGDGRIRVHSMEFGASAEFDIDELAPGSVDGWAAYPAGVAWSLSSASHPVRGLDAVIDGNLPMGIGLASSAAVEVAFGAALREASAVDIPDAELAKLCQRAENEFVGVRCGIMDQMASACAEERKALLIDCQTLTTRQVSLPPALRIVILNTGVERDLRSSEYNRRRRECEEALNRLVELDDGIRSFRDLGPEGLARSLDRLPDPLAARVRHVVGEIERVQLGAAALNQGETERFGELMFASHRSLRDDFQVSSDELDALVALAREAPGVVGARMTGAGFGGCTVNLVAAALADDFVSSVCGGYERIFGRRPEPIITDAAPGVRVERTG